MKQYDGIVLLSGGLDSILAAKVLIKQGLRIKCLHFMSPFFGKPDKLEEWSKIYDLDIDLVDVSEEFLGLLRSKPEHGVGSALNPCIDCKILLIMRARELMPKYGAQFVATGEVLGQRPMSQRRDALNIIRRDSGTKDFLLRPLCAKLLDETPVEASGLVDRSQLLEFSGRTRRPQLDLAEEFGITQIPAPAGGCLLTEKETSKGFWAVIRYTDATSSDFRLASCARQFWSFVGSKPLWLTIGRDKRSNELLSKEIQANDVVFKLKGFPGPLSIARGGKDWDSAALHAAASFAASFSSKALKEAPGEEIIVLALDGASLSNGDVFKHIPEDILTELKVLPSRENSLNFSEFDWDKAREEIRQSHCLVPSKPIIKS